MITIHVKVSGPGTCISNEMLIIEKALKDAGYDVEVVDEFPSKDRVIRPASQGWNIRLEANHCPWGG